MSEFVSSIKPLFTYTPKPTAYDLRQEEKAVRTLQNLIKSKEMVGAIAENANTYLPVRTGDVTSRLWAMFNTRGDFAITKKDVEKAVNLITGGTASQADALWKKISPDGNNRITVGEFALNSFVGEIVSKNTEGLKQAALQEQIQQNFNPNASILDFMFGGGLTV